MEILKKIKNYITMAVAGIMLLSFTGCNIIERTPESIGKTVLAKVEGEKITRAEVDKLLASQLKSYKEQYGDDFENNEEIKADLKTQRTSALDKLISDKVLISKKDDLGVEINDDDIKTEVDKQIQQYKDYTKTDDAYVQFLAGYGYTPEEFEAYMTEQFKIGKVYEAVVKDVTTTDEELQAYYTANVDTYKVNAGATVTHILFSCTAGDTAAEAKALAKAQAARALAVSGKTFDEIKAMPDYVDDANVITENLGHQDFENNSTLVTEFVAGFKGLALNEISQPVKTSYGYHIIKNIAVNATAVTQTFEEAKSAVQSAVLAANQETEYKAKLEEYKAGMDIKTYEDKY